MNFRAAILGFALSGAFAVGGAQITVDTSVNFKIQNLNSSLVLGVSSASVAAGAQVVQYADNGAADHLWHFMPVGTNTYEIVNVNSGAVLGISNGSTAAGSGVVQWSDNDTVDHQWQVISSGNYVKLKNTNSGLLMGIEGASNQNMAKAVLWSDSGSNDHLWTLVPAGNAYIGPGNVTGQTGIHDPSMVKTSSNIYYAYGTHDGIKMLQSADRTAFSAVADALSTVPSWTQSYNGNNKDLWAPSVSYHNGKYYLYYAASTFGSSNSAIGLATSTTGAPGSFQDQNVVYTSSNGYNALDPALIVDSDGKWWMSFGSFSANQIGMIQIDPATGKQLSSNTTIYNLLKRAGSSAAEGSRVFQHGSYYYLFTSFGYCCGGTNSTYRIAVSRSSAPNGPFVDKAGIQATQGGGTLLLTTHGSIIGPGGQDLFTDNDGDILVYHYYDGNDNGNPKLGINRLGWTSDGWPVVQ